VAAVRTSPRACRWRRSPRMRANTPDGGSLDAMRSCGVFGPGGSCVFVRLCRGPLFGATSHGTDDVEATVIDTGQGLDESKVHVMEPSTHVQRVDDLHPDVKTRKGKPQTTRVPTE
jgi:hypothetical protein